MTGPDRRGRAGDPVPDILHIWLAPLRGAFTAPTWRLVLVLVMGALLAPGKRTVSACLRITGRADSNYASYTQVLNRARWKPGELARRLTRHLVAELAGKGEPIIIGLDDTIERRWGSRISARGIYRDPVRSSHGHFACPSGLRWLSFMASAIALAAGNQGVADHDPAGPVGAMGQAEGAAALTAHRAGAPGDAGLAALAAGPIGHLRPGSSFGTHELADAIGRRATLISRLRLDANLHAPPEPRAPGQMGRPRQKGKQLPKLGTYADDPDADWSEITLSRWYGGMKDKTLEILSGTALWYRTGSGAKPIRWVLVRDPEGGRDPQAFFSTDPMSPARIIAIFARRWLIETTFQEARAHLGVETRGQWSDAAIERTTPVILGLYSLICMWAGDILVRTPHSNAAAWWRKSAFTFSDAIAAVRCQLWLDGLFQRSPPDRERRKMQPPDPVDHAENDPAARYSRLKVPPERIRRMVETLCYAA